MRSVFSDQHIIAEDPAVEIQCWLIHPLERTKNSHPGTASLFLWRGNDLALVSDGMNWKKSLSSLSQDIFPGLQKLNNWIVPMVHPACSEPKWCERNPSSFTSRHGGSAPPLFPCLLPQTCRERLDQQSEKRTTNYLIHWKGLQTGSTLHVSEEPKHCLKLV